MSHSKFAVITGGTRGIGRAITISLAESGYKVLAIYARKREAADSLEAEAASRGLSIQCVRADLADEAGLRHAIDTIRAATSQIDVVVHSAASGVHRETSALTEKHIAWTFKINVFAIQNLLTELIPMMRPGGRIVGITSIGATRSLPRYGAVGSSKGALEALFRHYAVELAPRGIAVNLVCPGLVMTDSIQMLPLKDQVERSAIDRTPTRRLTAPQDVAHTVVFLASEGAGQIVGQTITVDGGFSLS
jgi:enoyl-[acyl-carrier protein] reductase III